MGHPFRDTDLAGRFSWKFLRDADRRQVESVINGILAADNQQTTGSIMRALFTNTRKENEFGATVFDLYDGTAPYLGRTFKGRVKRTYVRGDLAYPSSKPVGSFLRVR